MVIRERFETIEDLRRVVSDEENAIGYFTAIRWLEGEKCPYCHHQKLYALADIGSYKCTRCNRRFSVKVGTIFQGSNLPISTLLLAVWYFVSTPAITGDQLAKELNIQQKTAWRLLRNFRQGARTRPFNKPLDREIEADLYDDLLLLQRRMNLSHGMGHASDPEKAEEVMRQLIARGHTLEPTKIHRWAVEQGWDHHSASELGEVANTVLVEFAEHKVER